MSSSATAATASLDPLEDRIIQYIKDNPGCSKSDIVRFMNNRQIASRITVLTYLDKLEDKKMIIYELEKPNSQIYKIYINRDNKPAFIITELEDFKRAYVNLLEKSKEIIIKEDSQAIEKEGKEGEGKEKKNEFNKLQYVLIFTPVQLFYTVVDLMFFRSMIIWSNEIKDNKTSAQIYSFTYKKIAEIQLELSKFFKSVNITKFNTYSTINALTSSRYDKKIDLQFIVDIYRKIGMDSEIQHIIKSLARLNEGMENLKLLESVEVKESPRNQIKEKVDAYINIMSGPQKQLQDYKDVFIPLKKDQFALLLDIPGLEFPTSKQKLIEYADKLRGVSTLQKIIGMQLIGMLPSDTNKEYKDEDELKRDLDEVIRSKSFKMILLRSQGFAADKIVECVIDTSKRLPHTKRTFTFYNSEKLLKHSKT